MARDTSREKSLRGVNSRLESVMSSIVHRAQTQHSTTRMVVILLVAFAFFTALRPRIFLNPLNLQNIAVASPEIGIIAIAMMLAMLTGGIDLSIVAIANMSAITITTIYSSLAATDPGAAASLMPFIVLLGIVVGLVGGLINGFLVSVVGITPILATLGSMQIFNGLAIVWTGGKTLYGAPEALTALGKSAVAGIPLLFLFFIAVAVIVAVIINRTPLGMKVQLQGTNPVAALYSGINPRAVLMSTYLISGLLGGFAGIMFLARNPTASADYGSSYVLLAIVIAVLGGTNPVGGFATVTGVVLATLTLQTVSSGFNAIRLSAYEYSLAQGSILIAVMIIDQVTLKRRLRAPLKPSTPASPEMVGKS
jgi:simple sugar transport system permease protein